MAEAVASSLGVSHTLVSKVMKERKSGQELVTPSRKLKRKPARPVRDKFDSFETDYIKTLIENFFKRNYAPTFSDIFLEYKNKRPEMVISRSTFRLVLRGMGFRYKRFNDRAVLAQ